MLNFILFLFKSGKLNLFVDTCYIVIAENSGNIVL